jgi:hypothetical protein
MEHGFPAPAFAVVDALPENVVGARRIVRGGRDDYN